MRGATFGVLGAVERRIRNEGSSLRSRQLTKFVSNIGNSQSDNLSVVDEDEALREIPAFAASLHQLVGPFHLHRLGSESTQRGDIHSAFRRYLLNHVTSGVTTRLARKSSKRRPRRIRNVSVIAFYSLELDLTVWNSQEEIFAREQAYRQVCLVSFSEKKWLAMLNGTFQAQFVSQCQSRRA